MSTQVNISAVRSMKQNRPSDKTFAFSLAFRTSQNAGLQQERNTHYDDEEEFQLDI